MEPKPYRIVDGKYHPVKKGHQADSPTEFVGDHWRVWREQTRWFLEYDEGHFATKMRTVEISELQYRGLIDGKTTVEQVVRDE